MTPIRQPTPGCRWATAGSTCSPACWSPTDRLAAGAHEHVLQRVVVLDAVAGAHDDGLQRLGRHLHRHLRLALDALREATQQAAAADEEHAAHEEVLGQLGRGLRQAADHRGGDAADDVVDGEADLLRGEQHGLRQAGHQVTATHLGLALVLGDVGRADGHLDLLGGALADGDAVLATHVRLDRRVDVEAARRAPPPGRRCRRG